MHLYRLTSYKTLLFILYNVISLRTTQQISLQKRSTIDSDLHSAENVYPTSSSARSHVALPVFGNPPFIVLMSHDTVSVAQLPMIVYGNLTDIYLLDTNEIHIHDDIDLSDSDDDDAGEDGGNLEIEREDSRSRAMDMHQHEIRSDADAREYEQQSQQMPQMTNVNTTTSLGKSEWQQIAVERHDREEVLLRAKEGGVGHRKEAAASQEGEHDTQGGGQQLGGQARERQQRSKRRRRRRSNSLSDYDDGDSNSASKTSASKEENNAPAAAASDAQTSRSDRRTAEESNSDMQNVTSAPSNVGWSEQQQHRQAEEAPLPPGGGNAPAEDGDKTGTNFPYPSSSLLAAWRGPSQPPASNRVRFSDFDVHMALGYAFVADSAGRVHRFKLASGLRSSSSSSFSAMGHTLRSNDIIGGSNVSGENSSINVNVATANSIGNSSSSHFESSVPPSAAYEDGYSNRISSEARTASTTTTEANDATHEQFENERQHPTASGGRGGSSSEQQGELSNSAGLLVSGENRQQTISVGGKDRDVPRIIWSRGKFVNAAEIGASSAKQRAAGNEQRQRVLANSGRASPATDNNHRHQMVGGDGRGDDMALASGNHHHHLLSDGDAQPPHASNNLDDDQRSSERKQEPAGNCATLKSAMGARQEPRTRHPAWLRTELAVDWLNNLLFVLDKCRLLVMDLEGNNELVLIDDFNANNRPVEIKVDPINGFLFWLQVGKFHNTIYKLNLQVLDMPSATHQLNANVVRLRQSASALANASNSNFDANDLVALVSHHYAHPIITNLPRHTRIFTLDHMHSKIYVPLGMPSTSPSPNEIATNNDSNKARDDAEVFAPASGQKVTHLNNSADEILAVADCGQAISDTDSEPSTSEGQILAYNIDGTDAGPLRAFGALSHINSPEDMQDLTLDSASGLLYWLTNQGRDLFEELRENSSIIQPAQHYLGGRGYTKLLYFDGNDANQPRNQQPQFNMRRIIDRLSSSISSNRPTRSGDRTDDQEAISLRVLNPELETSRFLRNAPYMILGVTCLIVTSVYFAYALIFQRVQRDHSETDGRDQGAGGGSISGDSSLGSESHMDINSNRFVHSTTMKWVAGPSSSSRNDLGATPFGNRNANSFTDYDLGASSTYGQTNAVDQHYRQGGANTAQFFTDSEASRLANLSSWPTNMCDLSNKQYVPIEVSQDDALNSIRRVSREQLTIDQRKEPLGQGHFGKVLQGTIKCTADEKYYLLERWQLKQAPGGAPISPDSLASASRMKLFAPSTVSSGHGSSSSTSCEFTTANTLTEPTSNNDYLTPKTQLNSTLSDYNVDMLAESLPDGTTPSYIGYRVSQLGTKSITSGGCAETKLRVAVKLLKDNPSPNDERDFLQEAKLLAKFDHPNIVRLIGICLDRGATFIVMELMLGGDLIRYMQANIPRPDGERADNLTYDDLLKICLDIANGCCYLEDMNHIHRDLAARNCLVSSCKREERIVKLADFGLARDIYKDDYYKEKNQSAMPLKWMAPECLWEQKFSMKSDVWSFGVVMWEVMSYCLEKPYDPIPIEFLKEQLSAGTRPKQPVGCDNSMYKLMSQCWQLEPSDRPTFHECRAMLIELRNDGKL